MTEIICSILVWLLGWLRVGMEAESRAQVEKLQRLTETVAAAKKALAKLEREFSELQQKRDRLHGKVALIETELMR